MNLLVSQLHWIATDAFKTYNSEWQPEFQLTWMTDWISHSKLLHTFRTLWILDTTNLVDFSYFCILPYIETWMPHSL